MKQMIDTKILTTEELAQRWDMHPGSLERWRNAGKGPKFIKLGSDAGPARIRYRLIDVLKYEESLIQ
jgi:hypothetical protein